MRKNRWTTPLRLRRMRGLVHCNIRAQMRIANLKQYNDKAFLPHWRRKQHRAERRTGTKLSCRNLDLSRVFTHFVG